MRLARFGRYISTQFLAFWHLVKRSYAPTKFLAFWNFIKQWWNSDERMLANRGLLGLAFIAVISVALAVLNNRWTKHFYASLENKDLDAFFLFTVLYIPLILAISAEGPIREYCGSWLSFRWRKWLTKKLQDRWLANNNYYKIAGINDAASDNPDQRISQDIMLSCNKIIELFHVFFREGLNLLVFSGGLWAISTQLHFRIPGFLVWIALLYSVLGFFAVVKIGKNLISLDRDNEKLEAIFRRRLIQVIDKREEIALMKGEPFEEKCLDNSFYQISANYYRILKNKFYVNLFNATHINGRLFISLALVGPSYFSGIATIALVMQARGMFYQISTSASIIINKFNEIASLIASLQRLISFNERLYSLASRDMTCAANTSSNGLNIKQLTILHSNGQTMWQVPDITLQASERKLLMAPSGTGKSTLLRVIGNLHEYYHVTSEQGLSVPEGLMIIPQKLYIPGGCLREGITYPNKHFSFEEIIRAMRICHLTQLIPYLDDENDYQQILSPGEIQRINFVRVLLHKPQWLIMDEPTAQLSNDYTQSIISSLIAELPSSGMLFITHHAIPHFEKIII